LVGVPNHPNWITFARNSSKSNDFPRVIAYINIRLSSLCFSLQKDIYNYRDIFLISFFNNSIIFFLINVYSDMSQSTLKYSWDTEANINNVLIMTSDFNIRNSLWDPNYPYHSAQSNLLIDFADAMKLGLFFPINNISTISEFKMVDSNYFIFLFLFVISFYFIFIFGDLELALMWHHGHTVTHQMEKCRRF